MNTVVRIASLFLLVFFLTPLNTVKSVINQKDAPVRQAQIQTSHVQIIEMAVMMPHETTEEPAARPFVAPRMSFNN